MAPTGEGVGSYLVKGWVGPLRWGWMGRHWGLGWMGVDQSGSLDYVLRNRLRTPGGFSFGVSREI